MPIQFDQNWNAPVNNQPSNIGNYTQVALETLTRNFALQINPPGGFQNAVQALAYNILSVDPASTVTVRRGPHQVEQYGGYTWVHYTLRAPATSYHLYLRTDPNDYDNVEDRVYVVSNNNLQIGIIWHAV